MRHEDSSLPDSRGATSSSRGCNGSQSAPSTRSRTQDGRTRDALNESLGTAEATPILLTLINIELPPAVAARVRRPVLTRYERRLLNRQLLELASLKKSGDPVRSISPVGPPCRANALAKPYRDKLVELSRFGQAFWIGARIKLGRATFDFADPETLAAKSESHTGAAIAGSVALLTESNHFFAASVKREISYKRAGSPVDICRPYEQGDALTCANVTIGAPAERKRTLGRVEYRKHLAQKLAIGPILHYDFNDKKSGISLPVYFLSSKDGLTGGMNVVWAQGKKFSAALFVGNVFSLKPD